MYLEQKSKVNGNVFISANKLVLNGDIGGSLYGTLKHFDMKYFGFISRDLHLTTDEALLNGSIYRDSFITAKNITTQDKFINKGNFTITDTKCCSQLEGAERKCWIPSVYRYEEW